MNSGYSSVSRIRGSPAGSHQHLYAGWDLLVVPHHGGTDVGEVGSIRLTWSMALYQKCVRPAEESTANALVIAPLPMWVVGGRIWGRLAASRPDLPEHRQPCTLWGWTQAERATGLPSLLCLDVLVDAACRCFPGCWSEPPGVYAERKAASAVGTQGSL